VHLCEARGIKFPLKALKKTGISHKVAWEYLNKPTRNTFSLQHIEKLCKLLNCTPNDLFCWLPTPEDEANLPNHPLQKIRQKALPNVMEHIKNVSIEDLENWVNGSKNI
jgi:DNA-binding Xre family transcriptional regulator